MVLPNTLDNWDIACKCCGGNEFMSRDEILTMPKSSEDEVRQRFGYDEFNAEELLKKGRRQLHSHWEMGWPSTSGQPNP